MPANFAYLSLFIWRVVVFILFAAIMCYSRLQMHKAQYQRQRRRPLGGAECEGHFRLTILSHNAGEINHSTRPLNAHAHWKG